MNKDKFLEGLKDGLPIGLGYLTVSFGIGISCHNVGMNALQGFLLSFLNNASAGEYGGITVIAEDAGMITIILMMCIINARYLLMSCVLSQHLPFDTPLSWRLLIGFDVTDELFGIAIAQPGKLNVWYYFGAMCAALPMWSIGTVIGILVGDILPVWAMHGCSVMLFGMFIAIIIPEGKKNKIVLGCIAISFLFSYIATNYGPMANLSEGMRVLILTVVISSVAAILFPIERGNA